MKCILPEREKTREIKSRIPNLRKQYLENLLSNPPKRFFEDYVKSGSPLFFKNARISGWLRGLGGVSHFCPAWMAKQ